MEEEVKKKGKQALGKCSYCGSTRKALYEKRWKRWIVVAHYCPYCGAIEWKYEPAARTSREFKEFWEKHQKEMEKLCSNCSYKRGYERVLDELQKKLGL
jgi:predicted nucleic-acid-binding Zn-ribbon protein